jgi:hypothetical protein
LPRKPQSLRKAYIFDKNFLFDGKSIRKQAGTVKDKYRAELFNNFRKKALRPLSGEGLLGLVKK